jgi:hypothetical protein
MAPLVPTQKPPEDGDFAGFGLPAACRSHRITSKSGTLVSILPTVQPMRRFLLPFEKTDIAAATILNVDTIERPLHAAGSLADLRPDTIPPGPGILEVKKTNRYLYIAHNDNLRPMVEHLKTGRHSS